ncbi:MAG: alpha/beta fold hydrolase [Angelakisella sp.]
MGQEEMLAGKEPFFWGGSSHQAVLCIHGFTGSPGLYRKLGHQLTAEGFAVSAPLLPGHGTTPEALIPVTSQHWIDAVNAEYEKLADRYERVNIVGLSLGGALATLLAAHHADEASLGRVVLISPGYGLHPALLNRLQPLLDSDSEKDKLMIPLPTRQPKGDDMDACIFGYNAAPVVSVRHLQTLGKQALEAVPRVKQPTLLLYTAADTVSNPALCAQAAEAFLAPIEIVRFEQGEHSLLLGSDRDETVSRILAFLR